MMLQSPSRKSKAAVNAKYLLERLDQWKKGDLVSLMSEARVIQKKVLKDAKVERRNRTKGFCRLMMEGKVGQALKCINNNDTVKGVHKLTNDIMEIASRFRLEWRCSS